MGKLLEQLVQLLLPHANACVCDGKTQLRLQVFLLLSLRTTYAYGFALELTGALSLVPYLLAAAYALKLAWTNTAEYRNVFVRKREITIALIAVVYTSLMLATSGIKYLLLPAVIYAPGTILYYIGRREQRQTVFTPAEGYLCGLIVVLALLALYSLHAGLITIWFGK